jgi:hypothetical protein
MTINSILPWELTGCQKNQYKRTTRFRSCLEGMQMVMEDGLYSDRI